MYLKHYNLKSKPFELTLNPDFIWFGEKHKEAYSVLRYGVLENKGLLLLTGDVGMGKTTLISALVRDLPDDIIYTTISDPDVAELDFYRYLCHGFSLDTSFTTKAEFLLLFRSFLNESQASGKRVLLIIDEAQRMGLKLMEDVRLLSNIEKNGSKLINVFFVGQTEFLDALERPKVRALRQRISLSYTIEPLALNETYKYIASRLKSGGAQANFFTKAAIEEIHAYSGGSPRMINVLCDIAMVVGYSKGVTRLEKQTVRDGARQLPGLKVPVKKRNKHENRAVQAAPQRKAECLVEQDILDPFTVTKRSGSLFLIACIALTLLFAVGMSWLKLAG